MLLWTGECLLEYLNTEFRMACIPRFKWWRNWIKIDNFKTSSLTRTISSWPKYLSILVLLVLKNNYWKFHLWESFMFPIFHDDIFHFLKTISLNICFVNNLLNWRGTIESMRTFLIVKLKNCWGVFRTL